MSLFKRTAKIGADGYERKTVQGYADKGPVAKLLADGWEFENVQPVMIGGNTLKQSKFLLKRRAETT